MEGFVEGFVGRSRVPSVLSYPVLLPHGHCVIKTVCLLAANSQMAFALSFRSILNVEVVPASLQLVLPCRGGEGLDNVCTLLSV